MVTPCVLHIFETDFTFQMVVCDHHSYLAQQLAYLSCTAVLIFDDLYQVISK